MGNGQRAFTRVTAVWASGSPTSSAIDAPWGHMAGGQLHISGAWTNSHIGLQQTVFGLWFPLMDWQCGFTGVSIPSASGNATLQMPPNWFATYGGDKKVVLWSHNGTGSGVPQGNPRTVVIDLKS